MRKQNKLLWVGSLLFVGTLASCKFTFTSSSSASAEETSSEGGDSSSQRNDETSESATESLISSDSTSDSASDSALSSDDYVPTGYHLSWSDEFSGDSVNSAFWSPQIGNGQDYGVWEWGNAEQEYYKKENASVHDGQLHILAKKETTSYGQMTYDYSSARLRSYQKVSTTYGYVVARIKLPAVTGMWPAFWMLPETSYQNKGWPTSGEIDIMENRGREPYLVGGTTHSANASYQDDYHSKSITLATSVEEWHSYAVEWTEDEMAYSCDGIVYNTVDKATWKNDCPLYSGSEPFNKPFHLILNMAVGGNFDGGRVPPEPFDSAEMSVDYVRIYQK